MDSPAFHGDLIPYYDLKQRNRKPMKVLKELDKRWLRYLLLLGAASFDNSNNNTYWNRHMSHNLSKISELFPHVSRCTFCKIAHPTMQVHKGHISTLPHSNGFVRLSSFLQPAQPVLWKIEKGTTIRSKIEGLWTYNLNMFGKNDGIWDIILCQPNSRSNKSEKAQWSWKKLMMI